MRNKINLFDPETATFLKRASEHANGSHQHVKKTMQIIDGLHEWDKRLASDQQTAPTLDFPSLSK